MSASNRFVLQTKIHKSVSLSHFRKITHDTRILIRYEYTKKFQNILPLKHQQVILVDHFQWISVNFGTPSWEQELPKITCEDQLAQFQRRTWGQDWAFFHRTHKPQRAAFPWQGALLKTCSCQLLSKLRKITCQGKTFQYVSYGPEVLTSSAKATPN